MVIVSNHHFISRYSVEILRVCANILIFYFNRVFYSALSGVPFTDSIYKIILLHLVTFFPLLHKNNLVKSYIEFRNIKYILEQFKHVKAKKYRFFS